MLIPLEFRLENQQCGLAEARDALSELEFVLGGGWDYHHGSFDRALDDEDKVWLRMPFTVVNGRLDSEKVDNEATIQWQQPFVLKHVYNDEKDPEARMKTFGALFDQFQEPVDQDAEVEPIWQEKGRALLQQAEEMLKVRM